MTLAPVFRSGKLFEILEREGIVGLFGPGVDRMRSGVARVDSDLAAVIDAEFIDLDALANARAVIKNPAANAEFLQKYFFLVLFSSVFEHIGIDKRRLDFYAELSYCIMGTIAAADNLFDSEAKRLLPLKATSGAVFGSVLQLMCFERLSMRVGQRAVSQGLIEAESWEAVERSLLSTMATIGRLEGSEESGTDEILSPREMVEKVHAIRGGLLFSLVTVAPKLIESPQAAAKLQEVETAVVKLGTAFQIVDDITDFEFDLGRKSHNILLAQIHHGGTDAERGQLSGLLAGAGSPGSSMDELFLESMQKVLEIARAQTRESLETLEKMGFWFPSSLADVVIQGIVAEAGVGRMERIALK